MFNHAANIFQKKPVTRFSTSRQIILAAFCDEARRFFTERIHWFSSVGLLAFSAIFSQKRSSVLRFVGSVF
jgi:hypothetical protein